MLFSENNSSCAIISINSTITIYFSYTSINTITSINFNITTKSSNFTTTSRINIFIINSTSTINFNITGPKGP